jgi:hypothetical protein
VPLPNLRALRLFQVPEAFTPKALPESLQILCIVMDFDNSENVPLLDAIVTDLGPLAAQSPVLKRLDIIRNLPVSALLHLTQSKHLRVLNFGTIHTRQSIDSNLYRNLIVQLATLDELLDLHLPGHLVEGDIPSIKGFPSLEGLAMHATPATAIKFLELLSSPRLCRVVLADHACITSPPAVWRECLDMLASLCGSTLRGIKFDGHEERASDNMPLIEVLRPLFKINQLEFVEVTLLDGVISAKDVHAMATAWPDLQHLKLYLNIGVPEDEAGDEGNNFQALASLAILCPKLQTLDVHINGCQLPSLSDWPHLTHNLRHLCLAASNIQDPLMLARLLDRIFPTLEDVSVLGDSDIIDDDEGRWEDVARAIRMFQAIWKEERALIMSHIRGDHI